MADYFIINKEDSADAKAIESLVASLKAINAKAPIIHANSPCIVADQDIPKVQCCVGPDAIRGLGP
jgi:G3E family GTPase